MIIFGCCANAKLEIISSKLNFNTAFVAEVKPFILEKKTSQMKISYCDQFKNFNDIFDEYQ